MWLVVFNADAILWLVVTLFGRIRGLPPVLKTAVKFPTQNLFRTGMTLAMFMLVVFTLTAMNFVQIAMGAAFGNTQEISSGYEIQANASYAAPIPDMAAAVEDAGGIRKGEVTAVAGVSNLPLEVSQEGTGRKPRSILVEGVDRGYSKSVGFGFQATARGYGLDREVWEALRTGDAAIISADLAPARNASTFGPAVKPPVKLSGFYADDESLPDDLYLRAEDSDTGETRELRAIGVLESSASFAGQIVTSQEALEGLAGRAAPPQTYYFDLGNDANAAATAKTLEKDFAESGLQTQVTAQVRGLGDSLRLARRS